jgi:hypothetical protein
MAQRAVMQTAIDHDAVRAPESIVELDQFGTRDIHKTMLHGEFLAPHRPAFVENGVREKAAQAAGVLELNNELQVVTGIGFVNRGEFQAVMLADFSEFVLRMLLV